jgi:DNA-binding SARP family transcriptional activator
MAAIRISLFGKFRVCCDGHILTDFDAGKVQELFSYLLLYRDRAHARETLAGLFWGACAEAQAKTYLRQAGWQIQTALETPSDRRLLYAEVDWVRINPDADLWLDVTVFEQAHHATRGVRGADLTPSLAQALHDAVDLYQSDLLEGCYDDWCLFERERLQAIYLLALDKLTSYCEAQHAYEAGLEYGMRILRYDRARERTHRRIMRLYYLAGDRTAALRQYERCVQALTEELGVEPAERTVALYRRIRAARPSPGPDLPILEAAGADQPSLPQVVRSLKQMRGAVATLQRELQRQIQTLEQATTGPRPALRPPDSLGGDR